MLNILIKIYLLVVSPGFHSVLFFCIVVDSVIGTEKGNLKVLSCYQKVLLKNQPPQKGKV